MNIENHINILLEKYNLKELYNKYIKLSIIVSITGELFNWFLLYFSTIIDKYINYIHIFIIILLCLIIINIPIEKYYNDIKNELLEKIKIANFKYFYNRIIKLDKNVLLHFDLVDYYNIVDHLNDDLEQYIINLKLNYELASRVFTLIIISITKKFPALFIIFCIFYIIVKYFNEIKIFSEQTLTDKYFHYENIFRNYIINSKNYLINNNFNIEHVFNNINKYENISTDIKNLNDNLEFKINIFLALYILIIMKLKYKKLNAFDFYYYFMTIYDIEYVSKKLIEIYKSKYIINKMEKRLITLYSFKPNNENNIFINNKINKIIINKFHNDKPLLINDNKIIINSNEHILINGKSGSGKTSLLYILKGIIKIDNLDIYPNIKILNDQSYLVLSNYKNIYDGFLYDIITNYSSDPNINLINYALTYSKSINKFKKNNFIYIDNISAGEKIRLCIANIIYTIKNTDYYNILLFDEIDQNLNDDLAIEIYNNIKYVFKDKIILYISHNDNVKKLFDKQIIVNKGIINYNMNN